MGAGASMEEEIEAGQQPRTGPGQPGSRPMTSAASSRTPKSPEMAWKKVQVMKAAAEGLKIIRPGRPIDFKNVVVISKSGFSISSLSIVEGEVVVFTWEAESGANGYNVVQVIHDGEQFRPVIGGIYSGPLSRQGNYEHLFGVEGEYKFVSAGLRCTPLTITVRDREDIRADLRDGGFVPNVFHIEQGNAIKWQWKTTNVPRMMHEVKYCAKHCSIVKPEKNGHPIAVTTGSYRQEFKHAGIYYFQSESPDKSSRSHFCAVHVKEIKQEHRVEVLDRSFKPMILLIEEGDRVWWSWDKVQCKKHHCVYQIDAPSLNHKPEESYKPKRDGFRWPQPSKHGQMSHVFKEPGVYYYSDHSFHEAAEYIGTIIVRPVQRELQVRLSPDGFSPDLLYARTGDRIWWDWDIKEIESSFSMMEIEKCLAGTQRSPVQDFDCKNNCQYIDETSSRIKTTLGLDTTQVNNVGVYHYRVADSPNTLSTSTIVVQPGPRNYTVHVTDKGFEPKVLSVSLDDRVWWVWQGTTKPHNVIQVSHQGVHIKDGFVSGGPIDAPSAYVRQFKKAGVFYYVSSSVDKFFGAVVVSTQSKVHEIGVASAGLSVDPLTINLNDVVAWTFKGLRQHDVEKITKVDQLLDAQHSSNMVAPRRCMNRVFKETPVFHFYSKSFWNKPNKKEQTKYEYESRVSTIIVNASHDDSTVVRVNGKGFFPPNVNVLQGCSVLWTWKGLEDGHNIIHVNAPNSDTPLSVIQGTQSFNSGKPVPNNSFLYTFDDVGSFCVASQGAPGFAGVVNVLGKEIRTGTPRIVGDKLGGVVDRYHRVRLDCPTADAKIFYTLNGKSPELHEENIRAYRPARGVVLKEPGLCIIRAIAVSESLLPSFVLASKRYWVLKTGQEDGQSSGSEAEGEEVDADKQPTTPTWQWWGCIPKIKGCFTGPGIIEIFWEPPSEDSLKLIRGYQIFLNGVSYCEMFPPDHNSLNIAGLAGGRTYDVWLEVFPKNDMFLPHKSNHLMMNCAKTIDSGGPLVSLETTEDVRSMALIWMSISSDDYQVAGYKLFLNGKQCGSMVVPDDDSNRCKVVIEECTADYVYRVAVMAVPKDQNQKPRLSNQLELSLPLETQNIVLPPAELREDDPDLYREYIEVREGSGYLPSMDKDKPKEEKEEEKEEVKRPVMISPVKGKTEQAAPPPKEQLPKVEEEEEEEQEDLILPSEAPLSESEHEEETEPESNADLEWLKLKTMYKAFLKGEDMEQKSRKLVQEVSAETEELVGQSSATHDQEEEYFSTAENGSVGVQEFRRSASAGSDVGRQSMAAKRTNTQSSLSKSLTKSGTSGSLRSIVPKEIPASRSNSQKGLDDDFKTSQKPYESVAKSVAEPVEQTEEKTRKFSWPPLKALRPQFDREPEPPRNPEPAPVRKEPSPDMKQKRKGSIVKPLPTQDQAMLTKLYGRFDQLTQELEELRASIKDEDSKRRSASAHSVREDRSERIPTDPDQYSEQPTNINIKGGSSALQYSSDEASSMDPENIHCSIQSSATPRTVGEVSEYESGLDRIEQESLPSDTVEIDATKGPWINKMKTFAQAHQAILIMGQQAKKLQKKRTKESYKAMHGKFEVEVQSDSDEESRRKPRKRKQKDIGKILYKIEQEKENSYKHKGPVVEVNDRAELSVDQTDGKIKPAPTAVEKPEFLPRPEVSIQPNTTEAIDIEWVLSKQIQQDYKLALYVVNVIGSKFQAKVNSDISFECSQEVDGEPQPAVQHCWNVTDASKCLVNGLVPGQKYRVFVVANYSLKTAAAPSEIQVTSSTLYYTTVGAPAAPKLRVQGIDTCQVCIEWDPSEANKEVQVTGYIVLVDGKQLGGTLNPTTSRTIIDSLIPGITISIQVIACTNHAVGNSQPSAPIKVSCPQKPPHPSISQQPSYKKGCVVVGWEKPSGREFAIGEDIVLYSIYLDGVWHGEVKALGAADRKGYQYYLTDLAPGQSYDVTVKSVAGQLKIDPTADHVNCLSESGASNSVNITCPAPPESPMIRIESMTPEGIDITWQTPQQFGDAQISGYQILKNGKLYGSTVPPDVQSLRIKDVELGEKVSLQLVALTEHPVGRRGQDGRMSVDGDSGIDGSSHPDTENGTMFGDKYAACKAGPKLTFYYTGLVQPPSKVWSEAVSGHSAMIVWNKAGDQLKAHHVAPDSYQVTWWPGSKPEDDINSQYTSDDNLLISNLKPSVSYTIVVEARKLQTYSALLQGCDENSFTEDIGNQTFILTGQSEKLTLQTARPPDPPTNIGVISTTCHSIQIEWDPPREHGVEVIGLRVDCYPVSQKHRNPPFSQELMPDATSTTIDGLCECTEHIVQITAITEEFFDQLPDRHELKKIRALPSEYKDIPASPWLPKSSVIAVTSGTDVPSRLQTVHMTMDSVTLKWKPARVYGSNRLLGQIVRWVEIRHGTSKRDDDATMASHMNLNPNDNHVTVHNLEPGFLYKFVVEAVVSVKTTVDEEKDTYDSEKKNRRTAHVPSQPVVARTRAPCEPPKVLLSGYTQNTIQLYWDKPILFTVLGRNVDDKPKLLKRSLEGYKLEINGKLHMRLGPTAQTCTLTKCKPGKTYNIVITALTCMEDVKKERKRRQKGLTESQTMSLSLESKEPSGFVDDDDENDEAPSEPLIVTLPISQPGNVSDFRAFYSPKAAEEEGIGDIHVEWQVQGEGENVRQFNIAWYCHSDPVMQKKCVVSGARRCTVPVTSNRSTYEVSIMPLYVKEAIPVEPQSLQVVVPGPPDAPEIFTKSVSAEEFIIEWGEPRLYGGAKLKGYQVYMNDKKVGNILSHIHHKAVIPCRPNRNYSIGMRAISGSRDIADSEMSNKLYISTHGHGRTLENGSVQLEDWTSVEDERELVVKVTKVTESSIHLDWSTYMLIEGCTGFKVQWSSVAQPAQRETRLSVDEMTCVINKCFPGTNHFIRVLVLGENDESLEKSRQLSVQTSAPPDTPVISTRAVNFKYIAIQWDKPGTYGDALVTGYKLFINGVVEAVLGPDQHTYSFTQGNQCQDYAFQVQALSSSDNLHSKPSEPLVITCPGVKAPVLKRAPTVSSNAVRVQWDKPYATDGVCCKQYKLYCAEEDTDKIVQVISPIHPDTIQAELHNLKNGSYRVYLEVYVHGSNDMIRSEPITIRPSLSPDPPQITVTVVGLEERRQLEKITADLINKRDKLLWQTCNRPLGRILMEGDEGSAKSADGIAKVEAMLEDCLQSLTNYTGHLLAHVSWTCTQSNPGIHVTGYKVLVDGKQYGCSLHAGIKNVRIKLNLNQPSHRLSMVAMAEQPHANSVESNAVELLTEPFQPFSFFCFHYAHQKDTRWPSHGCCLYSDTFKIKRKPNQLPVNQGILKRHLSPPPCNLRDVFDGEYKPLLLNVDSDNPTVLLFWTRWCLGSLKMAKHFVRFAKENGTCANFIAIACGLGSDAISERQELVHTIMENGWRDDLSIKHFTNQMMPNVDKPQDASIRAALGKKSKDESNMEVNKLFGIQGVPTILVIHPDNYVAYHGRYCAVDFSSFERYMRNTLDSIVSEGSTEYVDLDAEIDNCVDGIGDSHRTDSLLIHTPGTHGHGGTFPGANFKRKSPRAKSPRSPGRARPQSSKRPARPVSAHKPAHQRPSSSRKLFMRSNKPKEDKRISINNMRPLSASNTSNRNDGPTVVANGKSPYVNPYAMNPSSVSNRKDWEL